MTTEYGKALIKGLEQAVAMIRRPAPILDNDASYREALKAVVREADMAQATIAERVAEHPESPFNGVWQQIAVGYEMIVAPARRALGESGGGNS